MKRYLAEFLVAFFLVFAGMGAIASEVFLSQIRVTTGFGPLGIALAHGLALGIAIATVGRISGGHGNPAISIAFWVSRRMKAVDMVGYILAQLAGGTLAALFLKRVLPKDIFTFDGGQPALGADIGALQGAAIELILTFFLALVVWGVAVDKKGPKHLAPFAIGLTVTFGILAGGAFTGAAINPARWFGPALVAGELATDWYVWVAGPILGALLGSLAYEVFFLDDDAAADSAEVEVSYLEDEDDDIDDELETVSASSSADVWKDPGAESRREQFHDTTSPLTPPSPTPPAVGFDSPMVPPTPSTPSQSGSETRTDTPDPALEERRNDPGSPSSSF